MLLQKNNFLFRKTTSFARNLYVQSHVTLSKTANHKLWKICNKGKLLLASCTYLFPSIFNKSWHMASYVHSCMIGAIWKIQMRMDIT
jgi:hypothetical protein